MRFFLFFWLYVIFCNCRSLQMKRVFCHCLQIESEQAIYTCVATKHMMNSDLQDNILQCSCSKLNNDFPLKKKKAKKNLQKGNPKITLQLLLSRKRHIAEAGFRHEVYPWKKSACQNLPFLARSQKGSIFTKMKRVLDANILPDWICILSYTYFCYETNAFW